VTFEIPADWPADVREKISTLSESIEFNSTSTNGQNGYVAFGRNRITNADVAVKFYYWGGESEFHLEPKTLTSLSSASPYILKVWDAGYAGDEWAYYVTPLCKGGDLEGLIAAGFCGTKRAIEICSDVLHGLCSLHQRRFIHRDLKPGNVYLDGKKGVIGDFGSIAALPEGKDTIPASKHSLLYRPPESCASDEYGFEGDIYQVGILLYQLLGGRLPYDENEWLSDAQKSHAASLSCPEDRIYIDDCIKQIIAKGKLLDMSSLPPVVDERMRRIIRKATNKDPSKRFKSASDFLAKLSEAKLKVRDWLPQSKMLLMRDRTSYRVSGDGPFTVEKRRTGGWKTDHSLSELTQLNEIIRIIEDRPQR